MEVRHVAALPPIEELRAITRHPERFSTGNEVLRGEILKVLKKMFDYEKENEPVLCDSVPELYVDGFDAEQIWGELVTYNEPIRRYFQEGVQRLLELGEELEDDVGGVPSMDSYDDESSDGSYDDNEWGKEMMTGDALHDVSPPKEDESSDEVEEITEKQSKKDKKKKSKKEKKKKSKKDKKKKSKKDKKKKSKKDKKKKSKKDKKKKSEKDVDIHSSSSSSDDDDDEKRGGDDAPPQTLADLEDDFFNFEEMEKFADMGMGEDEDLDELYASSSEGELFINYEGRDDAQAHHGVQDDDEESDLEQQLEAALDEELELVGELSSQSDASEEESAPPIGSKQYRESLSNRFAAGPRYTDFFESSGQLPNQLGGDGERVTGGGDAGEEEDEEWHPHLTEFALAEKARAESQSARGAGDGDDDSEDFDGSDASDGEDAGYPSLVDQPSSSSAPSEESLDIPDVDGGPADDLEDVDLSSLSTYELEQWKLRKRMRQLENASLKEKAWELRGEVTAYDRPQNSLLQPILDYEVASKPAPTIDAQHTVSVESIIKDRIVKRIFDDVERKTEPREIEAKVAQVELEFTKSKLGLAEFYEKEYVKEVRSRRAEEDDEDSDDVELSPQQQKVVLDWGKLCYTLDSLSNFFYTPRPAAIEDSTRLRTTTAAAALVEDIVPRSTNDADLLAPEEVYDRPRKPVQSHTELEANERKAKRKKKKAAYRKRKREKERKQRIVDRINPGLGNKYAKQRLMEQLSAQHGVEVVDTKGVSSSSGSRALFEQLNRETQAAIAERKRQKVERNKKEDQGLETRRGGGSKSSKYKM